MGARALLDALPATKVLGSDKGYDADWFREALEDKGRAACILPVRAQELRRPRPEAPQDRTCLPT